MKVIAGDVNLMISLIIIQIEKLSPVLICKIKVESTSLKFPGLKTMRRRFLKDHPNIIIMNTRDISRQSKHARISDKF